VRASSGRERGGRCSAFIERGEEREREGRWGGGNGDSLIGEMTQSVLPIVAPG
jgi:hypothetical protein